MLICKTRIEGYKVALQKHEIEINEDYIVHSTISNNEGTKVFNYFMDLPNPPDGIFSILHRNAVEMMRTALIRGIKIPDEVALVMICLLNILSHLSLFLIIFRQK